MNVVTVNHLVGEGAASLELEEVRAHPQRKSMKRFKTTLLILFLVAASGPASSYPLGQGTAGIGGRVSPSVKLSLGQAWQQQRAGTGLFITAESVGLDAVQVVVGATETISPLQITLPLEIRTNVAYDVRVIVLSSEGCAPEIATSVGSIRSSGPLVHSGAAEAARTSESFDLIRCFSPATALRGPRVSARGNFNTIENALLANVSLTISPSQQSCYWRVMFRISLHPSA